MIPVFFVPHPPLAVPAVGRGQEFQIEATLKGLQSIGDKIADIAPETIIYVTPHGNAFKEAIAILYKEEVEGDLSTFGAFDEVYKKTIDMAFSMALHKKLEEEGLASVLLDSNASRQYRCPLTLDHGVLVPMSYIDQVYNAYKMVHLTTGFHDPKTHYAIGRWVKEVAEAMNQSVVVVCSGDMSHALKEDGPYTFNPMGKVYDQLVVEGIQAGSAEAVLAIKDEVVEAAAQCGYRSFILGFGATNGSQIEGHVYSYEGPFGVGYMTGALIEKGKDKEW